MKREFVLVTRPEPFGEWLTHSLQKAEIWARGAPLLAVTPMPEKIPALEEGSLILTTSGQSILVLEQALAHESSLKQSLLVGCVGQESLKLAYQRGFSKAFSPPCSVKSPTYGEGLLVYALERYGSSAPILYLSGDVAKVDLATKAEMVQRFIVYETEPLRELPLFVKQALWEGEIRGLIFHSARLLHIWGELVEKENLGKRDKAIPAFCLTSSLAAQAQSLGFKHTFFPETVSEEALIHIIHKVL